MIFVFLVSFCAPTLHHGDDPYKILGVRRDATNDEIKKAYRQMTKKYHPDVTKMDKKEAEKIWVRATDAYELLTDQSRRRIYDQTGQVSDEPGPEYEYRQHQGRHYHYQQGGDDFFFQFFNFGNFGKPFSFQTDEINEDNLMSTLQTHKECVAFVYSRNDPFTSVYGSFFEEVANEYDQILKFVRNDISNGQQFAINSHLKAVPSFVYLRLNEDETITRRSQKGIGSREELIKWIEKCQNIKVKHFTSLSSLQRWINANHEYTRIITIERGKEPSREFKHAASRYPYCKFAVLSDDYVKAIQEFKLTQFPANLVIRGKKIIKLQSWNDVERYSKPFFLMLQRKTLQKECYNFCLLRSGQPNESIMSNFTNFVEAPTTWISSSSSFAKSLNLKPGEWALITGKTKQYVKIDINQKYVEISKFLNNKSKLKPLECEVDWTFRSLFETLIEFGGVILSYFNPMRYFDMIMNSGFLMDILLFLFFILFIFPTIAKFLGV
ncbi:hypothetical protein TRFO_20990 [Tritrichomonas foetus]|uniref:J domain-containing protein n=1 Tax=Tritrichomonas foetus TaxID=1144522 RepID=A0A1J4KJK0_9EUKA|nr:hypothetical protein TRFO_20990 [Tritrichomonas foetus]|eukprot:OHT09988.1 hypothetical protein TRFO_20990 [Tritrichomonas foetus]